MRRAMTNLKWLFPVILFYLLTGCGGGGGGGGGGGSAPTTYTVTYDGNGSTGGSVPTDLTNYLQGQTVSVLGNPGYLTIAGYSFVGWNTQAEGNGTTYTQGQTFTMGSANVTLYARWTTNPTYTVTYNGNNNTGGDVPTDLTNYENGQTVTVAGNSGSLVKNGYFPFAGWNTQADGNGTNYTQGQTLTMGAANVTLYAKWGELPDTGQTTKYSTTFGDDSDYTINEPSYTDNGDGTIYDKVTGLTWQKCADGQNALDCSGSPQAYNWYRATGTYDATYNDTTINLCGSLSFAGGGWRLPTRIELLTIADYGASSPAINGTYFPGTQTLFYWSSTPNANGTTGAWGVDFNLSLAAIGTKTSAVYVRCVRGNAKANSFTEGTETVTDDTTGLMWQKCSNGQNNDATCSGTATGLAWESAISYCEGLSLGGFSDWRLPNLKELSSLVDDSKFSPAIDSKFLNTPSSSYWSSTTRSNLTTEAFGLSFSDGVMNWNIKTTDTFYVRCVRGQ